jgi:hypothetical protein
MTTRLGERNATRRRDHCPSGLAEAAMDCQAFCVLTATLMVRSSPYAKYAHGACAVACRDCAAACEGHHAEIMKECVQACRACKKVCRQMAGSSR